MKYIFQNKKKAEEKGFTLVELLVVMGLIFIIASISLFNYNKFGRTIELENTVYELALAIREAQYYGINQKVTGHSGSSFTDPPKPYGVHFNTGSSTTNFVFFVDTVGNSSSRNDPNYRFNRGEGTGVCVSVAGAECLNVITFNKGIWISSLKKSTTTRANLASVTGGILNITFQRPDPDAIIRDGSSSTSSASFAEITIRSPYAGVNPKSVLIGAAGQISIHTTTSTSTTP